VKQIAHGPTADVGWTSDKRPGSLNHMAVQVPYVACSAMGKGIGLVSEVCGFKS
jgi:hypothetical protein